MALALLVAQAINFGIVFSERTRAVRTQIEGPSPVTVITWALLLTARFCGATLVMRGSKPTAASARLSA